MQKFDLHMHTTYCDGRNTAEEMIRAAIERGLETVGLSGHSYTWFDESYCMSREGTEAYIAEVRELKSRYEGQIRVLLGTELDYHAEIDTGPYDYLIGSSHYLRVPAASTADAVFVDVDASPEILMDGVSKYFDGDMMKACECYYSQVGDIVRRTECDIIGHFDLVTKFNEMLPVRIVGTNDPRYIIAWQDAIDRIFEDTARLRQSGRPNRLEESGVMTAGDKPVFEINTGAIAKGYRTGPYPAPDQIRYIQNKGGILIMSSDSHSVQTVAYAFEEL